MPKTRSSLLLLAACMGLAAADEPVGLAVFTGRCAVCHEHATAGSRTPPTDVLRKMTVPVILRALESGVMRTQGESLSADERNAVAKYLGTSAQGSSRNLCKSGTAWATAATAESWAGWSPGDANWRFQTPGAAGLTAAQLPKLKLRWAYAFEGGTNMRAQPAVYRGRVILGGPDGSVVALDSKTGCTHWQSKATAQIRTGVAVAIVKGRALAFLGDTAGFVSAFDAETGTTVWKRRIDDHPATLASATPVFHEGRLYVGAASYEESSAARPDYPCCTFRGSVSALDAATGAVVWKTWTVPETASAQLDNKKGRKLMGPSGVGVWAAPTVDASKGVLYVSTGDNYSDPPTALSDSVLALALADGQLVWSKQLLAGDAFNVACAAGPNCPDSNGPDHDLGGSPMLVSLAGGRRAILVGQKSGQMHALDPDKKGALIWSTRVGKGGTLGGIQWGPATDGKQVYAAVSDLGFRRAPNGKGSEPDPDNGGGISALRVDNGEIVWKTPSPGCGDRRPCSPAQSAAVSAATEFVLSASLDGHLRAYDTGTGKILWNFDAAREFPTVNGVKGNGGAFDAGGPVVAAGMVFATSGYGQWGSLPGNVLLAFGVE